MAKCQFGLALECLHHAQDYGGLLLLATSAGDAATLEKLGQLSSNEGQNNVSFMANFLMGRLENCLDILITTGRLPEAAFFSRTYLPSQVSRYETPSLTSFVHLEPPLYRVVTLWKEDLAKVNSKAAQSLADPMKYENLFPELKQALEAETALKSEREVLRPAASYNGTPVSVK